MLDSVTEIRKPRRLKDVRQQDPSECGLASVATILQSFDRPVTLEDLRESYPLSLRGMSLGNIRTIATDFGLKCVPVRIIPSAFSELRTPAILHWGFDHFVVMERVKRNGDIIIMDPAIGRVRIPAQTVSDKLTGIALEFEDLGVPDKVSLKISGPAKSLRNSIVKDIFRDIGAVTAMTVLTMMLVAELGGIAISFLTASIVETIVSQQTALLFTLSGVLLAIGLIVQFAGYMRQQLFATVISELSYDLDGKLVDGLLDNPISYFEQRRGSHVLTNYQAKNQFVELLANNAATTLVSLIGLVISLTIILIIAPVIGGALVLCMFAVFIIQAPLSMRFRRIVLRRILGASRVNQVFLEMLRSVANIKTANAVLFKSAEWKQEAQGYAEEQYAFKVDQILRSVVSGIGALLMIVLTLLIGGMAVASGELSLASFLVVIFLTTQVAPKLDELSANAFALCAVDVYLDKIADLLPRHMSKANTAEKRLESSAELHKTVEDQTSFPDKLSLRNAAFSYGANLPFVFEGLDLDYNKPEMLGITGASGIGKSSIMKLLMGLHPPGEGTIEIDGRTATETDFVNIRAKSYALFQSETTIGASIEDNIVFSRYGAVDEQLVLKALETVELASDVFSMPMGIDSLIGDGGGSLSGGQVQRLMLARALYTKPEVLFLDEATSQIDPAREARIIARIREMGIGIVIVAHRAETLALADRILDLSPSKDGSNSEATDPKAKGET